MTANPARTAICDYPGCPRTQFIGKGYTMREAVALLVNLGWRVWRTEGEKYAPSAYCPDHAGPAPSVSDQ